MSVSFLTDPVLSGRGVTHGFGVIGWPGPAGLIRPEQVHGIRVTRVAASESGLPAALPAQADAIWSVAGGPPVGVVTADCVPILLGSEAGGHVAAIHAGWRGLAAGVIEATLLALGRAGAPPGRLAAAIGPHAGPCCYEVDAPVRAGFDRFGPATLQHAFRDHRPGHWMLDLGFLAREALLGAGLDGGAIGQIEEACTVCGVGRFESFRRDGAASGRLVHAVTPGDSAPPFESDPS